MECWDKQIVKETLKTCSENKIWENDVIYTKEIYFLIFPRISDFLIVNTGNIGFLHNIHFCYAWCSPYQSSFSRAPKCGAHSFQEVLSSLKFPIPDSKCRVAIVDIHV